MKKLARNRLRVKLFEKLMRFASALGEIPARTTPPPFRLMQIGSMFWQSRTLYIATKLGVADVIGDGKKHTRQIATELGLYEDHLYRLLRMLQSMEIFTEVSPRVFTNSKTSAFLRKDHPQNVRAIILMHNSPQMTKPWMASLEESMHDGSIPFARVHGDELFSYMNHDKQFDLLFSQAMDAVENLTGSKYLEDFNWGAFDRIIDVGGSKGSKTISILESFLHLEAIVFDRPQIIETASSYWNGKVADEVLARVKFQDGDMFESLPVAVSDNDLYVFFAIFHGLSDEESKNVLSNLQTAIMGKRPYILIVDTVVEELHASFTTASFDMQMLMGTRGRERTLSEWRQLLEGSGFEITEVIDVRTFVKFIVARTGMKS